MNQENINKLSNSIANIKGEITKTLESYQSHQENFDSIVAQLNQETGACASLISRIDIKKSIVPNAEEYCKNMGKISSAVHDLASKANMLAINTAIIAEKGTPKGEGIKVIAKELQVIAEQLNYTGDEITSRSNDFSTQFIKPDENNNEKLKVISQLKKHIENITNLSLKLASLYNTHKENLTQVKQICDNLQEILSSLP
jgi:methyl-accepting chemotaxis protein